jgi:hypothetical protein
MLVFVFWWDQHCSETAQRRERDVMRILVIQRPPVDCIDGMRIDRFMPGHQYEVGASLAARFLAERWAEPLSGAPPALDTAPKEFDVDGYQCSLNGPAALSADPRGRSRSTMRST